MKKAIKVALIALLAIVLALALALCALLGFAAWRRGTVPYEVSQWEMELGNGRDVMHVRLENFYDPDVSGLQEIRTVNRTGQALDEIVLRAYANGSPFTAARAVDISAVYVNDEEVPFAFDEEDPTVVRIDYAWQAEEKITLRWHISAPLTGEMTLISLPVLGVFENGTWRTDAWDPLLQGSYAEAFDVEIWMEFNDDVDVLFGSAVLGYADDPSGRIAQSRAIGARDVTLLVTRGKTLRFATREGVCIAAAADNAFAARALIRRCEKALASLKEAGIEYPFKALTAAQMDGILEEGYAASGLVALGGEGNGETQLRRLTRLIARQTFGVLAGVDAWQEPWLSHTLASTAELLAYRARAGEKAFELRCLEEIEVSTRLTRPYGVCVGAGIAHFGGEAEMTQVLRDQGAAMMLGIGEAIGYDALAQAMRSYAQESAGKITNRQALETALEGVSGSSWTGYLDDELAY